MPFPGPVYMTPLRNDTARLPVSCLFRWDRSSRTQPSPALIQNRFPALFSLDALFLCMVPQQRLWLAIGAAKVALPWLESG